MLVVRTICHFCLLQDPCACFFRQPCMASHAQDKQSFNELGASNCRPDSSATSRRLTPRWELDLPSLPTDDDRHVSARRDVKRSVPSHSVAELAAASVGCSAVSTPCAASRGLPVAGSPCGGRFQFRSNHDDTGALASSKSFVDSAAIMLCNSCTLLFIPKFQQALQFLVSKCLR